MKEIAAARPELLTHNGAVRYLLNTLKDTLRTDYTRRGAPVPEDAQLERETFQLIDHTLGEAAPLGATQSPGTAPAAEPVVAPQVHAADSPSTSLAQPEVPPQSEVSSVASLRRDDDFTIQLQSEVQKQKDAAARIEAALKAAADAAAKPNPPPLEEALAEHAKNNSSLPQEASEAFARAYPQLLQALAPHRQFVTNTIDAMERRMNSAPPRRMRQPSRPR